MSSSVISLSSTQRESVLAALAQEPGRHAWALQDLRMWPEQTEFYYLPDSVAKGSVSYLMKSGHPGAQRFSTYVLAGEEQYLPALVDKLPETPWVIRESDLSILEAVKRRFSEVGHTKEYRMEVTREGFRPCEGGASVRRITVDDLPSLAEFMKVPATSASQFVPWIRGAHLLGLWFQDNLVSIASTFVTQPEVWELVAIETKPEFRGRGFGAAVTSCLTALGVEHASCVSLTVLQDNEPALKLYKRLGFERREQRVWIDNGTGVKPT